jgi:hypothetical protein
MDRRSMKRASARLATRVYLNHCASLGLDTRGSGADDVFPSNALERVVVMLGIGATVNLVDL